MKRWINLPRLSQPLNQPRFETLTEKIRRLICYAEEQ
jgi:hypothetical protein